MKKKEPSRLVERAPGVYFIKLFQNLFLDAPDLPSNNNCCGNGGDNNLAAIKIRS
jgi:hypothetical protein